MENIRRILSDQRAFYRTHITKSLQFRESQLKLLYKAIKLHEKEISEALFKDFKKAEFESYSSETGLSLHEIRSQIKNLRKWAAPRRVHSNLLDFPSSSRIYPEPYGQVLIISPWNFPLQLVMVPLAGAIAAGNTAIIKPSEISAASSALIAKIIKANFPENYIACIEGGASETTFLLSQKNDFIFFTGSTNVGKIVMKAAAENLTPVVLELGGKNPCIVDETVPLSVVAKRIVWGKFPNAGQTCVAPDYIIVNRKIATDFKRHIKETIIQFYGTDPYKSPDFARIINAEHFKRVVSLIDPEKIYFGGQTIDAELYIAPTILHNISLEDKVMQEEVFGPVLPVLEYDTIEDALYLASACQDPLSIYMFSRNEQFKNRVIREIPAGSGNINDTVMHYINKNLPFGGIGSSGIGRYHGRYSFECFSNMKSMNFKSFLIDIPLRYPPYTQTKLNILNKLLR